jgi:hypothetical protein
VNRDRSLSDSGGDPFHGARADVTDSEDPGQAGFKEGAGRRGIGVVSCQDETTVVQPHGVFDPSGAGVGTDHDEEPADGPLHHASFAVADLDGSETVVAAVDSVEDEMNATTK